MSQPKVSIVVPVYNAEKYLERCISSLLKQTLSEIEIILVDDGSTDLSPDICERAACEDSRIRVIHKVNEGAGKARNTGLGLASGEYVGFVDSDDFVEYNMYEVLYKKAVDYKSDLVLSGVIFVDGNMFSEKGGCIVKSYFDKDTVFETVESVRELRMGIVGAKPGEADDSRYGMGTVKNLFKNEIIKKNNILYHSERDTFSEDATFMIDYICCIERAVGIPGAFYNYCRNGESLSKSYKSDRFEKSLVFVSEVEKRFKKDIAPEEYGIYIDRFWQAMCRVLCSQEIVHAKNTGVRYAELKKRLDEICSHDLTVKALRSYPIGTLPLKQRVFAYAVKYRMYLLMRILVNLRSR